MKKHTHFITTIILILSLSIVVSTSQAQDKFQSDWSSLQQHQTPKWLMDAKFGIYCHWGIQTLQYIPEYENLTNDERIALFKGEKFDADKWAKLFETAGAKFGGVIGWHGSDFKHWDSDLSDYNSYKKGPKIDIVGELSTAVRKRGMKFLTSFHSMKDSSYLPFAKEVINKYSPDIFWVDASFGGTKGAHHEKTIANGKYIGAGKTMSRVNPEKHQRNFITYFYNKAAEEKKEVEFVYKSHDIPPMVGMRDYENGILDDLPYDMWMTDMDINLPPDWATHGWFYRKGVSIRSADVLVDMLVDVVSKNGIFLLNIPPMADGSFPKEVSNNLAKMGLWLKKNGEAIYGTSPWFLYGEGPTVINEGLYTYHHNNHFAQISYTKEDIRFTVKGNNLYATCLGKPDGDLKIGALNSSFKLSKKDIKSITHLGSGKNIDFDHNETALVLKLAGVKLDEEANAFRIILSQ